MDNESNVNAICMSRVGCRFRADMNHPLTVENKCTLGGSRKSGKPRFGPSINVGGHFIFGGVVPVSTATDEKRITNGRRGIRGSWFPILVWKCGCIDCRKLQQSAWPKNHGNTCNNGEQVGDGISRTERTFYFGSRQPINWLPIDESKGISWRAVECTRLIVGLWLWCAVSAGRYERPVISRMPGGRIDGGAGFTPIDGRPNEERVFDWHRLARWQQKGTGSHCKAVGPVDVSWWAATAIHSAIGAGQIDRRDAGWMDQAAWTGPPSGYCSTDPLRK